MGVSTTTMNNYLTMRPPNFLRITTVSTDFDLPNEQAQKRREDSDTGNNKDTMIFIQKMEFLVFL